METNSEPETNKPDEALSVSLAKKATRHVLAAICGDPRKFYLMGPGTESWACLVTAHAELWDTTREKIEASFRPDKERYDAYCEQFENDRDLLVRCREKGITLENIEDVRVTGRTA